MTALTGIRTVEPNVLRLDGDDNVAIVLRGLMAGERLASRNEDFGVVAASEIQPGHKVALEPIPKGGSVRRYGAPVGLATVDIAPGEHVHVHNVRSVRLPEP